MRRLVLFGLLGPIIGYVVFVMGEIAMNGFSATSGGLTGLPVSFLFGLLPALCVGAIDWFLAELKLPSKPRLIAAIVTGYSAAGTMVMLNSGDWSWSFGLIGAVAAAICSWMSDEKQWTAA